MRGRRVTAGIPLLSASLALLLTAPSALPLPTVNEAPWGAWVTDTVHGEWGSALLREGDVAGVDTFIDVDHYDRPHILTFGTMPSHLGPIYAYHDGLTWQVLPVPGAAEHFPEGIRVDDSGLAHLIHGRASLNYTTFKDGTWTHETILPYQGASGVWKAALDLTTTGDPRITYILGDYTLHYATPTTNGWTTQQVATNAAYSLDLALDTNNQPHIITGDNNPDRYITYHHQTTTGTWTTEHIHDCEGFLGIDTDSQNNPHVSCWSAYHGLRYATRTTNGWTIQTIDDGSTHLKDESQIGIDSRLQIDSQDRPHIAYRTTANYFSFAPDALPGQLNYAVKTNGQWIRETVDRDGVRNGVHLDLVLDSQDRPHISHIQEDRFSAVPPCVPIASPCHELRYSTPMATLPRTHTPNAVTDVVGPFGLLP